MLTFKIKFINFIRKFQNSLFIWFLLIYGIVYLFGIFITETIYKKFENNFIEIIALQLMENNSRNIFFLQKYFKINDVKSFKNIILSLNNSKTNIYSLITENNSSSIQVEKNIIWKSINWPLINKYLAQQSSVKLMRAYDLGLSYEYENYYIYAVKFKIQNQDYINLNFVNPKKIISTNLQYIVSTKHISQLIILFGFMLSILITYSAVYPINNFLKKIQNKGLNSKNFAIPQKNEFNYIRIIRSIIYNALISKEQEEKNRLTMQNNLLEQQKDAEIGKIITQICHDLKSPLVIFEDILFNKSYENFTKNFESAKRSLNKILTLIVSLKHADKESFITCALAPLCLEDILLECSKYAKLKNLLFIHNIQNFIDQDNFKLNFFLDHIKIERAINNLLRNAIEHAKTKIILNVSLEDNNLKISIYDDGPGISRDVLPKLFQWRNTGHYDTGTGIGLYYSKQIACAHGGDLTYQHLHGMTRFVMILPKVVKDNNENYNNVNLQNNDNSIMIKKNTIIFFLQDKKKYHAFYVYFSNKSFSHIFFDHVTNEYKEAVQNSLVLYADSSEALFDDIDEYPFHIILHKQTDTPETVYKRIIGLYPNLFKV